MFGIKIKDPLNLPVTVLDRAVATVGVFNYWWSHHPKYGKWVEKLPFWAISGYIYFFKGLQQFNLFLYRPFPPVDKVSLIGATLSGNRGAEAMLATTIGKVREQFPDARFVLHSYFPKRDREICKDLNIDVVDAGPLALVTQYFPFSAADATLGIIGLQWPKGWMPRAVRELKDSRALLDLFGVSFNDGREKFLPFVVLGNLPAMLMKVPVVKLAQGLGKYEGKINRMVGKWVLRRCARVFARGQESYDMTRAIGIEENLDFAPDIAFLFEDDYALTAENSDYAAEVEQHLEQLRRRGTKILVLSLSSVVLKKCQRAGIDYSERMARIAEHFLAKGHAVVLFPNANREGLDTLHNNDIPVVKSVAAAIDLDAGDRLVAIDRDLNTAALRGILRHADWLVASRFHAMIAGLSLGIPTLVLGWSHKYREILAMFEAQEWAYDFKDLEVAPLIERIEALIAGDRDLRAKIGRNLDKVRAASQRQFDWLIDFMRPQRNVCTDDESGGDQSDEADDELDGVA
jgi:polysaccharide pyruvyl transferase WcaK-like protein